jgi:hypothetical protein
VLQEITRPPEHADLPAGLRVPSESPPALLLSESVDARVQSIRKRAMELHVPAVALAADGIAALLRAPSGRLDSQGAKRAGGRRRLSPTENIVSLLKTRHGMGWIQPLHDSQQRALRADPQATAKISIDHTFKYATTLCLCYVNSWSAMNVA